MSDEELRLEAARLAVQALSKDGSSGVAAEFESIFDAIYAKLKGSSK